MEEVERRYDERKSVLATELQRVETLLAVAYDKYVVASIII